MNPLNWIFWSVSGGANLFLIAALVMAVAQNRRRERDREAVRMLEEWRAHREWMEFKINREKETAK
jgi:hypothetical protein